MAGRFCTSPSWRGDLVEHQRAVSLLFAVFGLLVAVFVYEGWAQIAAAASIEDPLIAQIVPASTLAAGLAGVVAFFVLLRNETSSTFFDSVVDEILKIHWPSREETMGNTGVVVGATVFLASLLSVYDLLWGRIAGFFLFSGR